MTTVKKAAFNVNSTEGSTKAREYQEKLYQALMSKTPKERYQFLVDRGWTCCGKEKVVHEPEQRVMLDTEGQPHIVPVGKKEEFIRVTWLIPEEHRSGRPHYHYMNQTKALLTQLWWNMDEAGLIIRGRISY